MQRDTDLIVVGAGIMGLAVAHAARRRNLGVRVIDHADRPVGASVQNFGHLCFTAQSDAAQKLAERSAAGWVEADREAGLGLQRPGTTVAACTELEMQVLEEFASHRGTDQVRLLGAGQVRRHLGSAGDTVLGGAHLPGDMLADPRTAAPRLADSLADHGVDIRWQERVLHIAEGTVTTARGTHRAEQVIACPGIELAGLFPELADDVALGTCALTMALVERPEPLTDPFALLTGTSLTRYGGFSAMPSAADLRAELAVREPELVACDANLMVTGGPHGLLVGDSHSTGASHDPFIEEATARLLLDRAVRILGAPLTRVRQRWLGRYPDRPSGSLLIGRPDRCTTAAVITSGIGMTLAFGLAEPLIDGEDLTL